MIFLILVLPICLWVAWSDMARMKIPNYAVLALMAVFVIVGPMVYPLDSYFWRLGAGVVVLLVGFLMNQLGLIGAGDAKFAAVMAPFVAWGDIGIFLMLFSVMLLAAFILHRVARSTSFIRNMVPHWESWTHRKFPMGLALGSTLAFYICLLFSNGAI